MKTDQINLEIVAQSNNFNDWLYSEIKPYINGDILEVGSGLGTFSQRIISDFRDSNVCLSDINVEYLVNLKEKFGKQDNITVVQLDLNSEEDFSRIGQDKFDTIVCLNVLEHIKDDIFALQEMRKLLKEKGRLILLVPSHEWLFNNLDRAVGHYRRYSKKKLLQAVQQAGFRLKRILHFNLFAMFGWFVNGSILKKSILNRRAFYVFDRLVPIIKFLEKHIFHHLIGMSIVVILKR